MADNPGQAPQAADTAAEGDDGFTPDERAAFAEMEQETAAPPSDAPPADDPPADPAKRAAPAAAEASDAEDDDDDSGDDAPAAGAVGAAVAGAAGVPGAGEPKPKKRVSARKYERTEAELQKTAGELKTEREERTRLDERVKILAEALTPKEPDAAAAAAAKAEEDPEPDAEKDIFAHNAWLKRQLMNLAGRLDQSEQGRQAASQDTELANTYIDEARSFAAQEPHFIPAYQFLMANRTYELAQYFFGKDLGDAGVQLLPAELAKIKTTIGNEEKLLVGEAIKGGKSPAARIFALAKARGYRPAPPIAPAANGAVKPNGAAQPAANGAAAAPGSLADPGGAAAPRVEDEIARIRAGAESSRSLSDGGGAPASSLTPEKLANMPQEEFERLVENLTPAQERALFGDAPN